MKAVAVLLLGLVGVVAGGALRNIGDLTGQKEITSVQHGDDETTICFKEAIAVENADDKIIMVRTIGAKEVDFDEPSLSNGDKCASFDAVMPRDGTTDVAYSLFLGSKHGAMYAHATLTGVTEAVTLTCGGVEFERTTDVSDPAACVNDDTAATSGYCYKKQECSAKGTNAGNPSEKFSACSEMTKDETIGYVKSLSYDGTIKLAADSGDAVAGVAVVIVVASEDTSYVAKYGSDKAALTGFQREATGAVYTVCAVNSDSKFAESTIEDVNIIGKLDGGYYQFGFKYTNLYGPEYTAKSEGSTEVNIDCSHLTAGADTRCYGYLEVVDATKDLELSYPVDVDVSGTPKTRYLSIFASSDRLSVVPAGPE